MKRKNQRAYERPQMEVVEVKSYGMLCTSSTTPQLQNYEDGGDPLNSSV